MKLSRKGFTFIEVMFVLVILAIIAKFGVEFLAQAYRNYLYQEINNKLSNTSSSAVEFIAKRLQYRIRPSVIVRKQGSSDFRSLEGFDPATVTQANDYTVLEWIGYDIDSFRGNANATPLWSGIIDKKASLDDGSHIITPGSDLDAVDTMIQTLSNGNSTINDAALYLFTTENDINASFGWNGGETITDQHLRFAMHPVNKANTTSFTSGIAGQSFSDLFDDIKNKGEFDARYYLAWTAYAISLEGNELKLYYDYQPWQINAATGQPERYDTDGKSVTIMEHVNTFKMIQKQGIIKIQVCTTNDDMNGSGTMNIGGFALCKEKTIY